MALNEIPVLDESWPLFDWADWQSSKDALVPGTPTRYFAKEAWNAIVDSLAEALEAAGLEWIGGYTDTPEETKITTPYGKLSARKFNSVMCNIDRPAPLGWAWESNPDFRGYRGRMHLWGPSASIEGVDKVYPEYILELVRKLNVLLEIMRGTAMLEEVELMHNASLLLDVEAVSGLAAHVEKNIASSTQIGADIYSRPAVYVEASSTSASKVSVEAEALFVAPCAAKIRIPLLIDVEGDPAPACPVFPEPLLVKSLVSAELSFLRMMYMSAAHLASSKVSADARPAPSVPLAVEVPSGSMQAVEVVSGEALPAESSIVAQSRVTAEVLQRPHLYVTGEARSSTTIGAEFSLIHALPVEPSINSKVAMDCEIDTAWLPPEWVDGGLWIRQSYGIAVNGDGDLILPGVAQQMAVAHNSETLVDCALDTAWLPPVSVDDGLWIRQVRGIKVDADGGLVLSGEADAITVNIAARTLVSCELETAWDPPVWVNNGLWLRRSYTVTQNDNGELEVR